jgi:hypothetical protein
MAEGEFPIPHITPLTPGVVNYSELLRATEASGRASVEEQAQRSRGFQEAAGLVKGIGDLLFKARHDEAEATMRQDMLHAQIQFDKDAESLATQGKYTIVENAGSSDPFLAGGTKAPSRELVLDESFGQSVEDTTKTIAEKYKDFPDLQNRVYEQLGQFGVDAHRRAYDAAYRKAGENIHAGNEESLRLLAVNGDGSYTAGEAIIGGDPTLNEAEKKTRAAQFHSEVDKQYITKQATQVLQDQGLMPALQAVGEIGKARGIPEADKFALGAELTRMDNQARAAAAQQVQQAVDSANKSHADVLAALDEVDRQSPFKAITKPITDNARVDEWLKPAVSMISNNQEAQAGVTAAQILRDRGATEAQTRYAVGVMDTAQKEFEVKDNGAAASIAETFSTRLVGLAQGTDSYQGILKDLQAAATQMKAAGTYGKQASQIVDGFAREAFTMSQERQRVFGSKEENPEYNRLVGLALDPSHPQTKAWQNDFMAKLVVNNPGIDAGMKQDLRTISTPRVSDELRSIEGHFLKVPVNANQGMTDRYNQSAAQFRIWAQNHPDATTDELEARAQSFGDWAAKQTAIDGVKTLYSRGEVGKGGVLGVGATGNPGELKRVGQMFAAGDLQALAQGGNAKAQGDLRDLHNLAIADFERATGLKSGKYQVLTDFSKYSAPGEPIVTIQANGKKAGLYASPDGGFDWRAVR